MCLDVLCGSTQGDAFDYNPAHIFGEEPRHLAQVPDMFSITPKPAGIMVDVDLSPSADESLN